MKLTERQQLLAIIVGALIALLSLWYFVLAPQYQERDRLENEINEIARSLRTRNMLHQEAPLRNELLEQQRRIRGLSEQWQETADRLAGFPDHHNLGREDVGRIDFKAALFAVRERLRTKANEIDIPLPEALGMADIVTTEEDTRTLMLQLRAAERLADLALDLRIAEIQHIEPMTPIKHSITADGAPYLEEYPVRMVFHGSMQNMHSLFQAILTHDHVFGFRNFRIDRKPVATQTDHLEIDLVLSSLFFTRDADQFTDISEPKPLKRIPW